MGQPETPSVVLLAQPPPPAAAPGGPDGGLSAEGLWAAVHAAHPDQPDVADVVCDNLLACAGAEADGRLEEGRLWQVWHVPSGRNPPPSNGGVASALCQPVSLRLDVKWMLQC